MPGRSAREGRCRLGRPTGRARQRRRPQQARGLQRLTPRPPGRRHCRWCFPGPDDWSGGLLPKQDSVQAGAESAPGRAPAAGPAHWTTGRRQSCGVGNERGSGAGLTRPGLGCRHHPVVDAARLADTGVAESNWVSAPQASYVRTGMRSHTLRGWSSPGMCPNPSCATPMRSSRNVSSTYEGVRTDGLLR